ncbi:MAG: YfcE family phosphodiesterase [Campylobacter sputorum]|uniref:YfcE family phosphodiesterase n=1 Tax=Campylobacter sputorum TaxID=206 RepID=UPI000B7827C2|nr:YfcE family phosphodiesterase [Campylobacter sputorum]ASM38825.1 metallophosphatase [Campylobacter sputorum bv. paraureolyticus LMG 11764]MDY6120522.1 YfcE family phosphodiesterase [Campylobacter sputorum]
MAKIGIISDSHKRSDIALEAIDILKSQKVDILIHAGDIVEFDTLKHLRNSHIPYVAVLGNNDESLKKYQNEFYLYEEPYKFKFKNLTINLMHYPMYLTKDANINIYGHTHYFTAFITQNILYLNSGEICARKKPLHEFALVECDENLKFRVFKFQKDIKSTDWTKTEFFLGED